MKPTIEPSSDAFRRTAVSGAVIALVAVVGLEGASPIRWAQDDAKTATAVVSRIVSPSNATRTHVGAAAGLSALAFLLVLILRRWPTMEPVGPICPIRARRVATMVPALLSRRLSISYRIGGRFGG